MGTEVRDSRCRAPEVKHAQFPFVEECESFLRCLSDAEDVTTTLPTLTSLRRH
jgi:hypothetical protein